MDLQTPLTEAGGLTKRQTSVLKNLGVLTIRDLLLYFPFRHEDFSRVVGLGRAAIDQHAAFLARIDSLRVKRGFHRHISFTEAVISDATGKVTAVWFNQPYLAKTLALGTRYRFAGKLTRTKLGLRLVNPLHEAADGDSAYSLPFLPVYPLSAGISQPALRRLVYRFRDLIGTVADPLPETVLRRCGLLPIGRALSGIHFPGTAAELAAARRRLAFDELLSIQLYVVKMRAARGRRRAPVIPFDEPATRELVGSLPYKLTEDQRRAAWEILQDIGKPAPMYRLLDGDVGSGKTVVAGLAALNVARAGFQSALMAPTEILARQHYETLRRLLGPYGLSVALWTNAYKRLAGDGGEVTAERKRERDGIAASIAGGDAALVVGTHALIEDSLRFGCLALAIVDEQHRFGVKARQALRRKSGLARVEPHLLSMTATPIPRSLAMTVYGDLDISLIREKPKGRKPVATEVVDPAARTRAFDAVRREVAAGRQAFVICPLVDPSDTFGSVSVSEEYERLGSGELKGIPLAMLHGRMSAADKEKVMSDFLERRSMVLISTSVVEVGVDVPNATVICIEGAERFGLAQLHQFRGRVGRGEADSRCFLLPGSTSPEALERLRAVAEAADGFALAEKDLAMRGPGDLLGTAQSGFPPLRLASLLDSELIRLARQTAEALLADDPELRSDPELRRLMPVPEEQVHLE